MVCVLFFGMGCTTLYTKSLTKNPDDALRPFLGVELGPLHQLKKSFKDFYIGIDLEYVYPGAPANKAGLQSHDTLIAVNKISISKYNFKGTEDLINFISQQPINSEIELTVLRNQILLNQTEALSFIVKLTGRKYSFGESYADRKDLELNGFHKESDVDFKKLVQQNAIQPEVDALLQRFKSMTEEGDPLRLDALISLQKDPFKIHKYSYWVKDSFDKKSSNPLAETSDFLSRLNHLDPVNIKKQSPKETDLSYFYETYRLSQLELNKAFEDISTTHQENLAHNLQNLLNRFNKYFYLQEDKDKVQREDTIKIIEQIKLIKTQHFVNALSILKQVLSTEYLAHLKIEADSLFKKNNNKTVRIKNNLGDILITGFQNDVHNYTPDDHILLVIDLGGDDTYNDPGYQIIDFAGNDEYNSSQDLFGLGSIMNIRFIIDQNGNDRYTGLTGSFAATLFGISLLIDNSGDDVYRCIDFCFGSAFGGIALLIDSSGNDQYETHQFSQGIGIASGYGILSDLGGDDYYYSKGNATSSYNDPGHFQGWSQGVGLGLRGFISGGLGILYDRSGKDYFESGDFSQGGGYYFGWGLLINSGKEDDIYRASRYSQGFSAHYAAGSFIEEGGNDKYISEHVVGQGMSWDLSVTLFDDFAGNDTYTTCAHCLGTAAQSGITFFVDHQGRDTYLGKNLPYTENVDNSYHSGVSLGFFIDKGHSIDQYESFENNKTILRPKYQILIDE